jgi:hypothetical protein
LTKKPDRGLFENLLFRNSLDCSHRPGHRSTSRLRWCRERSMKGPLKKDPGPICTRSTSLVEVIEWFAVKV